MTPEREAQIRDRLAVVRSHVEADMALDLLQELDHLRDVTDSISKLLIGALKTEQSCPPDQL